ncbi:MAG: sulfite exporter TauE/SafE family protein, partial [Chloroflexi bacterium]|nr:sulfite exporter TauE/SafE family protein [Chloroflexota bacterium]
VFNSVQVLTFLALGLYDGENLLRAALMLAPTLVGRLVGFIVLDRWNPRMFNRLMLTVVAFTGANLLLRGLHVIA